MSNTAPNAGDGTAQDTTDPETPQEPQNGQDGQQQDGQPADGARSFDEAYVKQLRKEAAEHRTGKKAATDRLAAVAKALGLADEGDVEKSAEDIARERDERATEAQHYRQELVAFRAAAKHGIHADRLLDSRRFINQLRDIDSTADDYDALVAAAVTQAAKDDPTLLIRTAPPASGTHEHQGKPDAYSVEAIRAKTKTRR